MKKLMAVFVTGMLLMSQPVYAADRIEKEPVKVTGESVRGPEAEKMEKNLTGTAKGEEPEEAVQENAEGEAVKAIAPDVEGMEVYEAVETVADAGMDVDEEVEVSAGTAKWKEAVKSAAADLEHMPETLDWDGKMLKAYKEDGRFGFYYDAENYEISHWDNMTPDVASVVWIKSKNKMLGDMVIEYWKKGEQKKRTVETAMNEYLEEFSKRYALGGVSGKIQEENIFEPKLKCIPVIGAEPVGAYDEAAFWFGNLGSGIDEDFYLISAEKGYLKIVVRATNGMEGEKSKDDFSRMLHSLLIADVNWDTGDVYALMQESADKMKELGLSELPSIGAFFSEELPEENAEGK